MLRLEVYIACFFPSSSNQIKRHLCPPTCGGTLIISRSSRLSSSLSCSLKLPLFPQRLSVMDVQPPLHPISKDISPLQPLSDSAVLHTHALPYAPHEVPPRDSRAPSLRDDVRRTILAHYFRPSTTHYSRLSDLYALFLADNNRHSVETPDLHDKFRSALGRVLRPPAAADAFAKSFAAPQVSRCNGYISMISPDCPAYDLMQQIREHKRAQGRKRAEAADVDEQIVQLKEARRIRRLADAQTPAAGDSPQQISFRYVDELVKLRCSEDILKLKVRSSQKRNSETISLANFNKLMILIISTLSTDPGHLRHVEITLRWYFSEGLSEWEGRYHLSYACTSPSEKRALLGEKFKRPATCSNSVSSFFRRHTLSPRNSPNP